MKEKILSSIKQLKQKAPTNNKILLGIMIFGGIIMSINNNGLFITELLLSGFIILFALVALPSKN